MCGLEPVKLTFRKCWQLLKAHASPLRDRQLVGKTWHDYLVQTRATVTDNFTAQMTMSTAVASAYASLACAQCHGVQHRDATCARTPP